MNNWDIKPAIVVIQGLDIVPVSIKEDTYNKLMPKELDHTYITKYTKEQGMLFGVPMGIDPVRLSYVIDCFKDHMEQVPTEDWMHLDGHITERYDDVEVKINLYKGIYYGPNSKVTVYKIQ